MRAPIMICFVVLLVAANIARADQAATDPVAPPPVTTMTPTTADGPPAWENAKPERRGSFAAGIDLGGGAGAAYGYPNDSAKIGHPQYHAATGASFGFASNIWIGGALADWLTFGAGFGFSGMYAGATAGQAPYGLFHSDIYPLYFLGGVWRDIGGMLDFGLGFPTATEKKTDATIIDGAAASYVFLGLAWENLLALQTPKLRLGPFVAFHYMFSDSISRPIGLLGIRMTLYAKP